MKLLFEGHDYRYAVEQSLLAFFPEERPVYEGEDPMLKCMDTDVEAVYRRTGDAFVLVHQGEA